MLDSSKDELSRLHQEYVLFPPPAFRKSPQSSLSDASDAYGESMDDVEDSEELLSINISVPLCCERRCLSLLNVQDITDRQSWLKRMNKREQDISILSALVSGKKHENKSLSADRRTRFTYRFDDQHRLCRRAFLFVYGIREARLRRLQRLAASNVLLPSMHGNTHRIPVHALPAAAVNHVVQFVGNYAVIHGLPDPGRLRRNTREILLPRSDTYLSVWHTYREALQESLPRARVVGYDSFRTIWMQALSHIKFQGPRSDLCDRCDELKNSMQYATSQQELKTFMEEYDRHYSRAFSARTFYDQQIEEATHGWNQCAPGTQSAIRQNLSSFEQVREQKPCRRKMTMHYSFDFAQQVFYPYSSQQRGKEFFKTARKCHVFGVCAEPISRQVFFLLDESEWVGKGARTVISLLEAFFRLHGLGEEEATLHADNCTGQNKNNYVIWYLMWRVMHGLHKRISLSFMIPGHTKFAPDRYFGLFKIRFRRSTIDTLQDVVKCVGDCTIGGKAVAQVYGHYLGQSSQNFIHRRWDTYLAKYFNPIDSLLSYSYFQFDATKPGCVEVRSHPDEKPTSLNLLKEKHMRFSEREYPEEIIPEGLSLERQNYLYKEIRGFIRDPQKRDMTCPQP